MNTQITNIYSKSTARIVAAAKNIYDLKFKNDGEATLGGVFIFLIPILFSILCYYNYELIQSRNILIAIMVACALIIRVVVAFWLIRIANDLNRKPLNWVILSIFFPGITLTIIGARKKIKDVNDYKKHLWTPKILAILSPVTNAIKVVVKIKPAI